MALFHDLREVRFGLALGLSGLCLLSANASAQFIDNTSDIPSGSPGNNSQSENVDFGDVDNDGDWDAVFADGGDNNRDQNRIWINQAGLQGGTKGVFLDDTSARFPSLSDQSRDIEFVDFDGDEDLDIYVSNTSTVIAETNRWWRNTGVHSGSYVDETSTRWVNLSGPNSSVPTADVLALGFLDFSCDCDFGDLDNDGDMDLFHSSYGGQFNGNVPSRIFLNDGAGFFEEFNPSGYKLPNRNITNGAPGVWCEGTQQNDTTNITGANCDIASSALDIDIGDIDGDFDLDVLHGARQELPRLFQNRLEENGGTTLSFRDITGTFPSGYSTGDGHYEQEMGDLDGDGDLDIYGLNWTVGFFNFDDITLKNNGSGIFTIDQTLPGSQSDDNEGDFFDYDLDGDLDLFVANFTGANRLYRNNNDGGSDFDFTLMTGLPSENYIALDVDVCDVDGDGDFDVFISNDNGSRNLYYENTIRNNGSGPQDTYAPYIPNVEQAPDRGAGAEPTVVRAHVYDNIAYYITWYNETWLEVKVNGGPATIFPMITSGGQVFRGEIDGNLVGNITYQVFSEDEYGNQGSSAILSYVASGGVALGTPMCPGDGSDGTNCQCGNNSGPGAGEGCLNSQGHGAILLASGSASVGADDLVLSVSQARPTQPTLFVQGTNAISIPFKDGKLCTGSPTLRMGVEFLDAAGAASTSFSIVTEGNIVPGLTRYYQAWYRDPGAGSTCGQGSNFSGGLELTWLP